MEQDPNEVLRDIGRMQGVGLEEELEQEETTQETTDGQTEERQDEERQGEQASDEGREELLEEEEETVEQRYARLLEAHNALSAQMLELQSRGYPVERQPEGSPPAQAPSLAPQAVAPSPPVVPTFSFDDALLEKALIEDDPKAMKQVLLGMMQYTEQLSQRVQEQAVEQALRATPAVATGVARQQLTFMRAVEDFYTSNQDLAPYQHIVGAVANEITSKEPNLTIQDALQKTEAEVRKRLGLKKAAEKVAVDRSPAFAKTKSSRKPGAPVLTGMRADIAAMDRARL